MADPVIQQRTELFVSIGLATSLAETTAKNSKLAGILAQVIDVANSVTDVPSSTLANLLYIIASTVPDTLAQFRNYLARYVAQGKLRTNLQLAEAVNFLKSLPTVDTHPDWASFETACGVGVQVDRSEVATIILKFLNEHRKELSEKRYRFLPTLQYGLKNTLAKWAEGKVLAEEIDKAMLQALGPKTEEDVVKKAKCKTDGAGSAPTAKTSVVTIPHHHVNVVTRFDPNAFQARELSSAKNTPALITEHLAVTKGVVRTRFPPEPNGFLHIGHAKSMNLNFKLAFKVLGQDCLGDTIFRYDDTNPEAESQEYIDSQAENVRWMGWKPSKVTYSSDYFEKLYELAIRLIKMDKAYVCHQTKAEMEASKEHAKFKTGDPNSPWRNRPVEESLREFQNMRLGMYAEGAATLRLKMNMHDAKPCFWDPVAYRIKYAPHPHVGDKWCIYPSYDYSHCLIDSLEHIDYSLCTLEFETRRDSYYWLLDVLDMWRPHVWEFARLQIGSTVMSKRKLLALVKDKVVRGWDDPRICTINGLRRRGYTAEAINAFCDDIGITRHNNIVEMARLEHFVRSDLNVVARRAHAVLRPLKVVLVNLPADYISYYDAPNFPQDKSRGAHRIALTRVVYIDADDFREQDEKGYYGLAPGKTVALKYAGIITCTGYEKVAQGITELRAIFEPEQDKKVKVRVRLIRQCQAVSVFSQGHLHWVSGSAPGQPPMKAQVRLYKPLFNNALEMQEQSEVILHDAMVDMSLEDVSVFDKFQFERVGYFCVDADTKPGLPVFNQTVGLRESPGAKVVRF